MTESMCHKRTGDILKEVKCVKGATTRIDKGLAELIAERKGERKGEDGVLSRLGAWAKIIGMLIVLGGIVWGMARITQPDVASLARAVADEVRNGPVAITRGDPT